MKITNKEPQDCWITFNYSKFQTRFTDVLNTCTYTQNVEVLSKSESVDILFEERMIELAKDIVTNPVFNSSMSIADFMKDEIINRYAKIYGTNWLVVVGFGHYYDLSYHVKNSKRKFIDFQINELRFCVFQSS